MSQTKVMNQLEEHTMRALACLGDQTTYGKIISATSTWLEDNKPIAQRGDLAWCGKCNGAFPIIGTADDWFEAEPYVATGDQVACGCPNHVVYGSATQYTTTQAQIQAQYAAAHQAADALIAARAAVRPKGPYSGRFQLIDQKTGKPIAGRKVKVWTDDGWSAIETTDAEGQTAWVDRDTPQPIYLDLVYGDDA